MAIAKKVLFVLVGLAILLCLVGLALPGTYRVERSIEIAAPMIKVYPHVYNPKDWARWGVWNRRDPGMSMTYSGAPAGVGAKWAWKSKSEGDGNMEITKAEFDKRIDYILRIDGVDGRFDGHFLFAPNGGKVKVTWVGEGDMGMNPIGRWFALLMDKMLGPDFEGSLNNLKELAEKGA
jgi:hypothetical protein